MSRLNDIIRQVANIDEQLAKDLKRETDALADRRAFGLNFERHVPEAVELPGRPVRKNDKVRVLPPRGEMPTKANDRLWRVDQFAADDGNRVAHLVALDDPDESQVVAVDDLVVVAEFRDPIYPGLVSTGKVERGGDKPFHTVINAENYHALQALLFTHRGKVDAIYIDPPYNTGAKDWKYNNDYVEKDDHYRHSKWLAFMERRLLLARELLNPDDSALIVTIDEKEYLRLGLLLEQVFPDSRIDMVSSVISSQASVRDGAFSRCHENIFFVMRGAARVAASDDDMLNEGLSATKAQLWFQFVRTGSGNRREDRSGMYYPIYGDALTGEIREIGDALDPHVSPDEVPTPDGLVAIWPETSDGRQGRWRTGPEAARRRAASGLLRLAPSPRKRQGWSAMSVNSGTERRIADGEVVIDGRDASGGAILREISGQALRNPKTVWNKTSHNAGWHGSKLLSALLPGRSFPYPKSLYAVEDTLRLVLAKKPNSLVLDFFAGSGTAAHAVMRLNRQDGGSRRCILVTNNEVSAAEQERLRQGRFRPGDPAWEELGICTFITRPRIEAAITGLTAKAEPIQGKYNFKDEFPMADGFQENVEFFTLTYESPMRVSSNREFTKIAPLLWMRAGSRGRRIDDISPGWDVADTYGVIANLDYTEPFVEAVVAQEGLTHAFIVTDEDRLFEAMVRQLPDHVEPVRLYSSYLRNFEIEAGRASR